jgi:hypothetical protein
MLPQLPRQPRPQPANSLASLDNLGAVELAIPKHSNETGVWDRGHGTSGRWASGTSAPSSYSGVEDRFPLGLHTDRPQFRSVMVRPGSPGSLSLRGSSLAANAHEPRTAH